jgi:hypothetical protein
MSARQEDLNDGRSSVSLNSSKPRWNLGKLSSCGKPSMVVIFVGNDAKVTRSEPGDDMGKCKNMVRPEEEIYI